MKYIAPKALETKYTCPHCSAIAQHRWATCSPKLENYVDHQCAIRIGHCTNCGEYTIWHWEDLIYPNHGTAPPPNPDMPEPVTKCYQEAAGICSVSPRGAAALLRLALQVLCGELGEKGKNINDDIAALVKRGLPPQVQQSLDIVRVTGNSAVHPGQIDTDSQDAVTTLFTLLNVVVDYMITLPKQISDTYGKLPQPARDAIAKRDK
ncbi:hypothetical protein CA51_39330 [Rosistilla oblonga]|uniref:DUF4145 domain-containing protein n=1 Tax=Rosistilla oblonga TaxID=2527990 RepID=UPI00118CF6FF|nr:DUF4145 domain-containing protein [Rosistilla oblonga]QDV14040.1 hypothetical protein CA51_39330 [Rosistilla oblonga]